MATFRWPAWDPFSGLRLLQREIERAGRSVFGDLQQAVGGGVYPPVNIFSGPDDMIVQCEMAGVAKEDVQLSITGETLSIRGLKKPPRDHEQYRYQRRERGLGEFDRTIVLPDKVDADRVEAKMEAGVLTVRLPKSEAAKPKQVQVK